MQAAFYGVGAAVIGIITLSTYKLTTKSVGKFNLLSFKEKWMRWTFFTISLLITAVTKSENILLFILSGLIYMLVKAPPKWLNRTSSNSLMLLQIGFWHCKPGILTKIALFFGKAGTFVFGSGLAIIPFLRAGVVTENKWLTEQEFLDAVAVTMITPGLVVIATGFIGYLIADFPGATVAALATFIPCYLFTILLAPYFKKIAKNKPIKAFVEGITAAVVGALAGAVIAIATKSILDIPTLLIAVISLLVLVSLKKIQEPFIIAVAAILGIFIKLVL
jgi:chromate transporter